MTRQEYKDLIRVQCPEVIPVLDNLLFPELLDRVAIELFLRGDIDSYLAKTTALKLFQFRQTGQI